MSQHCWAQHVACVWSPCCDMLLRVGCCWLKFDQFQTWANNSQHVATRWPNARNMLRPTMLRHVALVCCDRLAGALVLHCASLLRTILTSLAHAHERVHVHNLREFTHTKFNSDINAPFLSNEHGDRHFLFYKFNENSILNNWEKNWQKSMATFFGPTRQVQVIWLWVYIIFPLRDKTMQGIWRHSFFWDVDE